MLARSVWWMVAVVPLLLGTARGHAQEHAGPTFDSLLMAHRHPVTLSATAASGPGFELLLESAAGAQFFIIAEEHNLLELNQLTVGLFDELQKRYGVQHLVLEQGSVIASWIDAAARAGGGDSVRQLVRRYPHAPTFATDEELELMTHVRQTSVAPGPAVWGVDQELAAMHLLEYLAERAPTAEARTTFDRLAKEAYPYEHVRTGDVHYLYSVADPDEYAALSALPGVGDDPEVAAVLDALQRTIRIYAGQRQAQTTYASNLEREESMRARFMERYRAAHAGSALPKAIVKMGHWHTLRGFYRGNVLTFGTFLTELAAANGMETVVVSTHVVNSPDAWRNSQGVIERVADPTGVVVVDLRPLRPMAHTNAIADLSDGWRTQIFQADFLLIIGGGRTGAYDTAYGAH
jgi:hypothetical protein